MLIHLYLPHLRLHCYINHSTSTIILFDGEIACYKTCQAYTQNLNISFLCPRVSHSSHFTAYLKHSSVNSQGASMVLIPLDQVEKRKHCHLRGFSWKIQQLICQTGMTAREAGWISLDRAGEIFSLHSKERINWVGIRAGAFSPGARNYGKPVEHLLLFRGFACVALLCSCQLSIHSVILAWTRGTLK